MPPEGYEPAIPETDRPQTYALDLAATGIGYIYKFLVPFAIAQAIGTTNL